MTSQSTIQKIKFPIDGDYYDHDYRQVRKQDGKFQVQETKHVLLGKDIPLDKFINSVKKGGEGFIDITLNVGENYEEGFTFVIFSGWVPARPDQIEFIEADWDTATS